MFQVSRCLLGACYVPGMTEASDTAVNMEEEVLPSVKFTNMR